MQEILHIAKQMRELSAKNINDKLSSFIQIRSNKYKEIKNIQNQNKKLIDTLGSSKSRSKLEIHKEEEEINEIKNNLLQYEQEKNEEIETKIQILNNELKEKIQRKEILQNNENKINENLINIENQILEFNNNLNLIQNDFEKDKIQQNKIIKKNKLEIKSLIEQLNEYKENGNNIQKNIQIIENKLKEKNLILNQNNLKIINLKDKFNEKLNELKNEINNLEINKNDKIKDLNNLLNIKNDLNNKLESSKFEFTNRYKETKRLMELYKSFKETEQYLLNSIESLKKIKKSENIISSIIVSPTKDSFFQTDSKDFEINNLSTINSFEDEKIIEIRNDILEMKNIIENFKLDLKKKQKNIIELKNSKEIFNLIKQNKILKQKKKKLIEINEEIKNLKKSQKIVN